MTRTARILACLLIPVAAVGLTAGCTITTSPDGDSVTFEIAGLSFTITLGGLSPFDAPGNGQPVRQAAAVPLFTETPDDRPVSADLVLNSNQVAAQPLNLASGRGASQTLSGSATVRVYIDDAASTDPCEQGIDSGTFELTFSGGSVTITDSQVALPPQALAHVLTGTFTICLEVTATVDVRVTIQSIDCVFGPDAGSGNANDNTSGGGSDNDNDNGGGPPVECAGDADCSLGEVCIGGSCEPQDGVCSTNRDCADGEICSAGTCIPDSGGCGSESDCADGEICNNGRCEPAPQPGFQPAEITYNAAEQLIAGAGADPAVSVVLPAGYAPYNTSASPTLTLSGDGGTVWMVLYDEFPNVAGDPQSQIWSVETSGGSGAYSPLPDGDFRDGLQIVTDHDGSVALAENARDGSIYRLTPGQPAALLFSVFEPARGCVRGVWKLDDDGGRAIYASLCDGSVYQFAINGTSTAAEIVAPRASLALEGISADIRMGFEIDGSSGLDTWIVYPSAYDSQLQRLVHALTVGEGLSAPGLFNPPLPTDIPIFNSVGMTDDGAVIGYCHLSSGDIGHACYVQPLDGGGSRTPIGAGEERVGGMTMSDDGSVVFARTMVGFDLSSGQGFLQDVATGERRLSGSQVFSGTATPNFGKGLLSDDGRIMAAAVGAGAYVLHNGAVPSGFPTIDAISYRFDEDDCKLIVRVAVTAPLGVARMFTLPLYDGLEPTRILDEPENPLFNERGGSGVNQGTTFTEIEPGLWEREISLSNAGTCKQNLLTERFGIRIVLVEATESRTTLADFIPLP